MKQVINAARKQLEKLKNTPIIGEFLKPKPVVAVVRLSGVISDSNGSRKPMINHKTFAPLLDDAFDIHNLKAVALVINCPGGSPAQSELVAQKIRRLAEDKKVPVIAFVEDVAASGGYWLACAADEIYACETSIVGSIGVISASFGFQELIERHGIERRIHTAGQEKSFLDPFSEEQKSDVKRLKSIQSDLHDRFISWVKDRRANKLDADNLAVFEGEFWLSAHAQELGLIDNIGYIDTVIKEQFGDNVKCVDVIPDRGFLASLLGGEASLRIETDIMQDALNSAEMRATYGRYGL